MKTEPPAASAGLQPDDSREPAPPRRKPAKRKPRAPSKKSQPGSESPAGNVLESLHREHIHCVQLLDAMQEQAAQLANTGDADFALLRHMLDYLLNYPDRFHHPREDLLFQRLIERDHRYIGEIKELEAQHVELHRDCKHLLRRIKNGSPKDADGARIFATQLRDFIDFYRLHMDLEEGKVFPAIKATLQAEDWAWVNKTLAAQDDPVFGPVVLEQYQDVSEYIKNLEQEGDLEILTSGSNWLRSLRLLQLGIREANGVVRQRSRLGWAGNRLALSRYLNREHPDNLVALSREVIRRNMMHTSDGLADVRAIFSSTGKRIFRPTEKTTHWREQRRH